MKKVLILDEFILIYFSILLVLALWTYYKYKNVNMIPFIMIYITYIITTFLRWKFHDEIIILVENNRQVVWIKFIEYGVGNIYCQFTIKTTFHYSPNEICHFLFNLPDNTHIYNGFIVSLLPKNNKMIMYFVIIYGFFIYSYNSYHLGRIFFKDVKHLSCKESEQVRMIELLNFFCTYTTSIAISFIWIFGPDVLYLISNEEEHFYVSILSIIMKSNIFLYIFFNIGVPPNSKIELTF